MEKMIVTGRAATFGVGDYLVLTAAQIAARAHAVAPVDPDLAAGMGSLPDGLTAVSVRRPVQFKRGEMVGVVHSSTVAKAMVQHLAPAGTAEAAAAVADVAEAKARGEQIAHDRAAKAAAEDGRRRRAKTTEPTPMKSGALAGGKPRKGKGKKAAGLAEDDTAEKDKAGSASMQPAGQVSTVDGQPKLV